MAHNKFVGGREPAPMKAKVEVDCTPAEARAFLGLPDVSSLNEHLVEEMKSRLDANLAMLAPEELMRNWMALGRPGSEQFMKLMTAAAGGARSGAPRADERHHLRAWRRRRDAAPSRWSASPAQRHGSLLKRWPGGCLGRAWRR